MPDTSLKVISIASCWRSGSTLLGRLLGHAEGFVTTGGLGYLWKYGILEDWPCTCGAAIRDCPFWKAVFEQAYGGFETDGVRSAMRSRVPMLSSTDMFKTLVDWPSHGFRERVHAQAGALASLYGAIAAVSGSRCIVDSSRFPSYALALSTTPSIDLYVIHLVRDSRAVVHSVQRRRAQTGGGMRDAYADTRTSAKFAWGWIRRNTSAESLRARGLHYMQLRYEDFSTNPRAAIARVARFVGENLDSIPFVSDNVVTFHEEHEVEGNRLRFSQGNTEIRLDAEWQQKMPSSQKRLITLLTWPYLQRYGYPV